MDYTSYNLINTNTSSSSSTPIFIPSSYSRKPIISRNGKNKALSTDNNNTTTTTNNNNKSKGRVRLSTDPQSVAARERRHRISDRFKMLQSLIPGGAKLDTVSMLEQAIQYVKYLKAQILLHETIINNSNKVNNDNKINDNNKTGIYQDHQYNDHTIVYDYNDNSNTTVNDAYYYDQYRHALMNDNSSNYHVSYQQLQGGDGVGGVNGGFCYDHQKMINMATVTPNPAVHYQNLWGYQGHGLAPKEARREHEYE